MSRALRAIGILVILALAMCLANTITQAGTGQTATVKANPRTSNDDLGYEYYQFKWVTKGSSYTALDGDFQLDTCTSCWDTLRIGRDLNFDGTVDSTFTSGEGAVRSKDYVPIAKLRVFWFGATVDSLYIRFLDDGNLGSTNRLGTLTIVDPPIDEIDIPARCKRIAVSGGRTGGAGAWLVIAFGVR